VSSLALNSLFGTLFSSPLTEEQYYDYLDQGMGESVVLLTSPLDTHSD